MSDSGFGKVAEPASEMIITPLDSTWDQAVYNLNHRPHPAFATDTDDEDDDENEGGDQDQVGGPSVASLERGGDSCPASSRARWDYWTPEERRQPHPGLVRKVSVMREDCELLSREEEGETGDLSDGEHYQPAISRHPAPPPVDTSSTRPASLAALDHADSSSASPFAPSPSLAAPVAHDFAFDHPSQPHSPPPPTPSLVVPPNSRRSSPLRQPFGPPPQAVALSHLPVPPRPVSRHSSPPAHAPDSFGDPPPLPGRGAGPSGAAMRTYGKKRAQSEVAVVVDSSDGEPDTAESMRAALQEMGRKPAAPTAKAKPAASLKRSKTTPAPSAAGPPPKKVKAKPRKSTDEFLDAIKTMAAFNKHKQQHSTISSTIDRLAELPVVLVSRPLFVGVNIVLVNHYSTVTSHQPNAVDIAHRTQMKLLLRNGATLIKPEDFRSPTYRSDRGPLATHIVPLEEDHLTKFNPTFDQVLDLLGPRRGSITIEKLGKEVQVVGFKWVSDSLDGGHRLNEARYAWPGDPRWPLGSPTKRGRPGALPPRLTQADGDASEVSTDQDDEDHTDGTDNDYPPDAALARPSIAVATGSFAGPSRPVPLRGGIPSSLSSPIPSPRRLRIQPGVIEGLEKELGMVQELGPEFVDGMFAEGEGDASDTGVGDLYVFSALDEDNQTDDEDSDGPARKTRMKGGALLPGREGKFVCDQANTARVGDQLSPNERAAQVFDSMSELVRQDKMRQRAYRLAAGALRNRADLVDTYEKAKEIRGIGHKLALKVVEIQKTGTLRRLANTTDKERVTAIFREIYGVGSVIANDLFDLGCRTLDDVRNLTDHQYKLNPAQRLGLRYYDDLSTKMPRAEVTRFHDLAREAAAAIDPKLLVFAMGSYIRRADECGDVDFIVTRDTSDGRDHGGMIKRLWRKLIEVGMIRHSLADPGDWESLSVKYNGLCAVPGENPTMRRIDILGVPWDELPAARIYFTGNDFFNRSMRLKAAHLGLRLNQRGLYQDVMRGPGKVKVTEGVRVAGIKTEQDIFRVLEVPWREPWERLP